MKLHLMQRVSYSWLLSVLLPGLGHLLWGEYLFGIFIFLIMLLAIGLAYMGVFLEAGSLFYWVLTIFPILFFVFSLLDLKRAIEKKRGKQNPSSNRALLFLLISLLFQLLIPGTPARFLFENKPTIYTAQTSDLSPVIKRGDLVKVNPMAYFVRLFFYDRPVYFSIPERFDLVRFSADDSRLVTGVVIGLPEESLEATSGEFIVDGIPVMGRTSPVLIDGDCPLTTAGPYSILVAELHLGRIKKVHEVSLFELAGKVSQLL